MSLEHDYHTKAAPDVNPKANRVIWSYFIFLGILLFGTMGGLTIYYRFELQDEKTKRIGEVQTREILDYKSFYKPILAGEKGIFINKKNISVDLAMKKFLNDLRMAPR